jgi:hypothetical protein
MQVVAMTTDARVFKHRAIDVAIVLRIILFNPHEKSVSKIACGFANTQYQLLFGHSTIGGLDCNSKFAT